MKINIVSTQSLTVTRIITKMSHSQHQPLRPTKHLCVTVVSDEHDAFTDFETGHKTAQEVNLKRKTEKRFTSNKRKQMTKKSQTTNSNIIYNTAKYLPAPTQAKITTSSNVSMPISIPTINKNMVPQPNIITRNDKEKDFINPKNVELIANNRNVNKMQSDNNAVNYNYNNQYVEPTNTNNYYLSQKEKEDKDPNLNRRNYINLLLQSQPSYRITSHVLQYFRYLYSSRKTEQHIKKCNFYKSKMSQNCYVDILNFLVPLLNNLDAFQAYVSNITTAGKNMSLPLDFYQTYYLLLYMIKWTDKISKTKKNPASKVNSIHKISPNNDKNLRCIFQPILREQDKPSLKKHTNHERLLVSKPSPNIKDKTLPLSDKEMKCLLANNTTITALPKSNKNLENILETSKHGNQTVVPKIDNFRKRTLSADRGFTNSSNFHQLDEEMKHQAPKTRKTGNNEPKLKLNVQQASHHSNSLTTGLGSVCNKVTRKMSITCK